MNRLKELREEARLTAAQLGDRVGLSHVAIIKYERGENPIPGYHIEAFARIFNVLPQELFVAPLNGVTQKKPHGNSKTIRNYQKLTAK